MRRLRSIALAAAIGMLNGCSGGWWPFGGSSGEQQARLPEGAAEYLCAQGRRLVVRFTPDGKSVWVFFSDREFRLDRVGSSDRYSNGVSTLIARDDALTLDSEGSAQFADCRQSKS